VNELSKAADDVDAGQMKSAIPITTLFLDSFAKLASPGLQNDEGVIHETR
jgi:hypothetical protein